MSAENGKAATALSALRPRFGVRRGSCALLLVVGSAALLACGRRETSPTEEAGVTRLRTAGPCDPIQREEWIRVRTASLGASGWDPNGHTIRGYPARKFFVINNWYPMDDVKQTLCGKLHDFKFFDGLGSEADWNNYLIPTQSFVPLLEEGIASAKPGKVRDCGGGRDNCIETEITPVQSFFENPYFPRDTEKSPLEGTTICTYGPWVGEKLHGDRPEIHPSELIWWTNTVGGQPEHFFLVVQDDSKRFHNAGRFDGPSDRPGWRPWSGAPRSAVLRIAFEWTQSETPRTLYVQMLGQKVVSNGTDDNREHVLEYEGKPVLKVEERQVDPRHVDVQFEEVCRDPAQAVLRGYVELSTKVDPEEAEGNEGFAVIRVGPRPEPMPSLLVTRPKATVRSPRRVVSDGKPELRVDIELEFPVDARRRTEDSTVTDAILSSGRRLPAPTPLPGQRTVIRGVPVEPGASLSVGLQSGRRVPIALPGLGVAPVLTRETPELSAPDPSAWENLLRNVRPTAPAARTALPNDLQLKAARRWSVTSQIEYAPLREGEVAPEDDSSLSEELNAIVRQGNARRISGPGPLFSTRWTFRATDVTTGTPVRVAVNEPALPNQVRVDVAKPDAQEPSLRVSFPAVPASHIYRLVAQAVMTDVFGHTGELTREVWSHVLTAETSSKLADSLRVAVARLAEVSLEGLEEASRLETRRQSPEDERAARAAERDPRRRRARLLRLASEGAAEDSVATIDELNRLVRVAGLLRER
jgi:hypothetical protein